MNPRKDGRMGVRFRTKAVQAFQIMLACLCMALFTGSCVVPPPQEEWPDLSTTQDTQTTQDAQAIQDTQTPGEREGEPADSDGAPSKQGPLTKALLYLPNRLVDFTDIFSFGISLITTASDPPLPSFIMPAAGLHVNVHATRAVQFGLGVTYNIFVGKGYQRRFYWKDSQHEASLLPFTAWKFRTQDRDDKEEEFVFSRGGMLYPSDAPFREGYFDYWAIGTTTTLVVFGVSVDVHPVEIADAILGFALIDISGDDF